MDLGTLGGPGSSAYRVNDNGQVTGWSDTSDGKRHTFLWTSGGGMRDLGSLPGATELDPAGLSPNGQVAGNTLASGTNADAFYSSAATGMLDVGTLGGSWSQAVAVNDNGQVAGYSPIPSPYAGSEHAFLWTQNGGIQDLGTLGGRQGEAFGMNGSGQVVGWSYTSAGDKHAFSWTEADHMIDLTAPGFGNSEALEVNEVGQVVGDAVNPDGREDAFIWTAADGMRDLGVVPGGTFSVAAAVNTNGQVVGFGGNSSSPHAFSWTATGGMVDLGTLGGSQSRATAVNDNGVVVGWSFTTGGQRHAFAWTQTGGMIDLDPAGTDSAAYSANNSGQVVGYAGGHATLWQLPAAGFVTRNGTELLLDGLPYRPIGLNIYNASSNGWCWYQMDGPILDDSLTAIGPGKNSMRAWFFQPLATTNGRRDWSAFDHTLGVARVHGVKVIATLTDQWGDCGVSTQPGYGYKDTRWYQSAYKQNTLAEPASYRDWVKEVVSRYKDEPAILAWQLVNEPEVLPYQGADCSAVPESTAESILAAFAGDVSELIKSIDPHHLVSLGTIGSGQCGAQGDDFQTLMSIPTLDLCEFHDYNPNQLVPGDQWNGLQRRIDQCNELRKPILVGELGIRPIDVGGSLQDRADVVDGKLCAQFRAGIAGVMLWAWDKNGSLLDNYDIGPQDPVLGVLSPWSDPTHTCSSPSAPTDVVAAPGDGSASVSWLAPTNDGGAPITGYTVRPHDVSAGSDLTPVSASGTSARVSTLTNGHTYTFTVAATNAAGTSAPSAASNAVTPQAGNVAATGIASATSATTVSTGSDPATTGGTTSLVTVPSGTSGGGVSIVQTATTEPPPSGFQLGNVQIVISAPTATATNPLTLVFTLTPSAGQTPETTEIYRTEEGGTPTLVSGCDPATKDPTSASYKQAIADPCVWDKQSVTIGGASYTQLTVLTSHASAWNEALPRPGAVSVSDSGYSPNQLTVQLGALVNWSFLGGKAHSATDSAGLGAGGAPLFDSGALKSGAYSTRFRAAGNYAYKSTVKGDTMTGAVLVPVLVTRSASGYVVVWATGKQAGYVFDVQYRFKQAGSQKWTKWTAWKAGVATPNAIFVPTQGAGTYSFHAELRNLSTGKTSGDSPEGSFTTS